MDICTQLEQGAYDGVQIGAGQSHAQGDPSIPDVMVLPEQLQPATAKAEALDDEVHLLRLAHAAEGHLLTHDDVGVDI